MIVYRLDEAATVDDEQFQQMAKQILDAHSRRTPRAVVLSSVVTVESIPDSARFRAKNGPTPRWIRRPAVAAR